MSGGRPAKLPEWESDEEYLTLESDFESAKMWAERIRTGEASLSERSFPTVCHNIGIMERFAEVARSFLSEK